MTWDEAVAFALTLPETELSTTYGQPAVKVNNKPILNTGHEADTSFVVHVPLDEKLVLIETDPDSFWQTPHYENWPAILVRYDASDHERVKLVLTRAWWDRASKIQRKAFGDRP